MSKYVSLVKMAGEQNHKYEWCGVITSDSTVEAMVALAVSVAGYNEEHMSDTEILRKFWADGWRARLYELKTDENGDEFEHELLELI